MEAEARRIQRTLDEFDDLALRVSSDAPQSKHGFTRRALHQLRIRLGKVGQHLRPLLTVVHGQAGMTERFAQ